MNKSNLPESIVSKMKSYTPFQQKVWLACAAIPKGQTRSYGWIAKKIGHAQAVRAVGTAVGANPFAPTVPCHRVVRSDGKIGEYSGPGGRAGKIEMLRKEGALKSGKLA